MLTRGTILRFLRYLHALAGVAFGLFLIIVVVNAFLLTVSTVDGHSMDPTFNDGEPMLVYEKAYIAEGPNIGDVVIVQYAGNNRVHFVKRVQGIPGDTVQVGSTQIVLGQNEYYVLGDNRDHSTDSRVYGAVNRKDIIGKVLWPLRGAGPGLE